MPNHSKPTLMSLMSKILLLFYHLVLSKRKKNLQQPMDLVPLRTRRHVDGEILMLYR